MDSDAIVDGFRKERQILASLDHPNIARLLDGGTTDAGLPYFVMDYVEGVPLDEYCDTHKLSLYARLELFTMVCSAVHYAHERGVVHRDLKPANICVTAEGVPKLLDFGIAKVLDPELGSATAGTIVVRPLTPAYASPEQVRGDEITRASDIYSLGVMLYELLTGHRPYRLKSHTPQEIERVICEHVPEKPSKMVRRLTGDLDTIVLMALRKEPARRYTTVEQFSDDIRRHLESRPIRARKSTLIYRTTKFVERNRSSVLPVALSVVIILAVIGFAWSPYLERPVHLRSIAVLPFQPLVGDTPDESVESGMTDGHIEQLSRVHQLAIRSPDAVRKYAGATQDPQVAGSELRVDALLVGKVQRTGDRIRLSVRLVDALDGSTMWSETFDQSWTDIFAIQESISNEVARTAAVRLTRAEREQLAKRDTDNPEAYREYLIGRHFWSQRTNPGLKQRPSAF